MWSAAPASVPARRLYGDDEEFWTSADEELNDEEEEVSAAAYFQTFTENSETHTTCQQSSTSDDACTAATARVHTSANGTSALAADARSDGEPFSTAKPAQLRQQLTAEQQVCVEQRKRCAVLPPLTSLIPPARPLRPAAAWRQEDEDFCRSLFGASTASATDIAGRKQQDGLQQQQQGPTTDASRKTTTTTAAESTKLVAAATPATASWEAAVDDVASNGTTDGVPDLQDQNKPVNSENKEGNSSINWSFLLAADEDVAAAKGFTPSSFFYPPLPPSCFEQPAPSQNIDFFAKIHKQMQQLYVQEHQQQPTQHMQEQQQQQLQQPPLFAVMPPPPLIEILPPQARSGTPAAATQALGAATQALGAATAETAAAEIAAAETAANMAKGVLLSPSAKEAENADPPDSCTDIVTVNANSCDGSKRIGSQTGATRYLIRKSWCVCDNTDVKHFRRKILAVRQERMQLFSSQLALDESASTATAADTAKDVSKEGTSEREKREDASHSGRSYWSTVEADKDAAADTGEKQVKNNSSGSCSNDINSSQNSNCNGQNEIDSKLAAWLDAIPKEEGDLSPVDVPLALEFLFPLDDFQKRAILRLEKYQTVVVVAHTSAGKTVVAEYAIALAVRRHRRCIYTSPLKALSNQKYREFRLKFPSVGIITGDVCINPEASCLIVTTEILRSLLYRGDAIIGQVDSVIFDEAHYISDLERGVVWEEAIILLPKQVNMVLLSATVPNYVQMAEWLGAVKQREIFVLSTEKRPTSLRHFLFLQDKTFLLMDAKEKFQTGAYHEAFQYLRGKSSSSTGKSGNSDKVAGRGGGRAGSKTPAVQNKKKLFQTPEAKLKTEVQRMQALITKLDKTQELPVVVFCFSRRKCELFAQGMRQLDVVHSHTDRSKIHLFIKDCLMALSPADRDLPQIRFVCSLVQRGLGIHHGGLLPLLKEMVEIVFQRGLVRVLFATETLAIGLNMPARSVVFSSLYKHDGQRLRMLHSSEYTQMAGRAGRRGIDLYGNVFIFCRDELPEPKELTGMMAQKASPLLSRFRLTYHTLLLLGARSDSVSMTSFIAKSFLEAERVSHIPRYKRDLKRREKELQELPEIHCVCGEKAIEELADMEERSRQVVADLHMQLWKDKSAAASVFCSGRAAFVHSLTPDICCSSPALFLHLDFKPLIPSEPPTFKMLVLLPAGFSAAQLATVSSSPSSSGFFGPLRLLTCGMFASENSAAIASVEDNREGVFYERQTGLREWAAVGGVSLLQIETICEQVIKTPISASLSSSIGVQDNQLLSKLAQELDRLDAAAIEEDKNSSHSSRGSNNSNSKTLSPLSLSKPLKKLEMEFVSALLLQKDLFFGMRENQCFSCPLRPQHMQHAYKKKQLQASIKDLRQKIDEASLYLYPEMQARLKVLKSLKLLDENGVPTLMGRVACQVMVGDDLTLALLLFQNVLEELTPCEVAAVLSAFVCPEGNSSTSEQMPSPTVNIQRVRDKASELHSNLMKLQINLGLRVNSDEWWKLCDFSLSMVAFEWASGVSFGDIMQRTHVHEGSIVRCILRLDELLRKIKQAAVLIGDGSLDKKMQETSDCIRRDIIFAMSLYLQ